MSVREKQEKDDGCFECWGKRFIPTDRIQSD